MVVSQCGVVGVSVEGKQAENTVDVQFDVFTKVVALMLNAGGMSAILYEHLYAVMVTCGRYRGYSSRQVVRHVVVGA